MTLSVGHLARNIVPEMTDLQCVEYEGGGGVTMCVCTEQFSVVRRAVCVHAGRRTTSTRRRDSAAGV